MDAQRQVRTYSAAPLLATPGALLGDMLRDLVRSRGLALRLAGRDIKAQYRQSALGYLWAFLPPLMIAASFMFLRARDIVSADTGAVPYGLYVIVGALLWQVFADALMTPLRTFSSNRDMLVKVTFPREALVVGGMLACLFGVAVRALVLAAACLHYDVPLHAGMWLALPGVLVLVVAGTCVGLLLTPFGVLFKDIEKALAPLLMLWMLVTPVAYPLTGATRFNFVTPLLEFTRSALLGPAATHGVAFVVVTVGVAATLTLGWLLLRLALPHAVARLGM